MKRSILDTSAYSSFARGHRPLVTALQETDEIYLSPVALAELRSGFLGGKQRVKNEHRLREFMASPRVSMAFIDEGTAERYAVILNSLRASGTPIPTNDIWIAASAMQWGLHILTTDAHYLKIKQVLVDYFEV